MCCSCCSVRQQKFWVFGLASISGILGLLLIVWGPTWADDVLFNALPLSPTSSTFEKWVTTPIPIYMHMYLFNWSNVADVRKPGVKPHFDQMGPYVFREQRKKEDLTWNADKTVTFYSGRTWYFEPELSGGSLDDNITCPHLPSLAAASIMRNQPRIVKKLFNRILNRHGGALYQTHTANEWLFEGFFDEFLNYSMSLNNSLVSSITSNRFAWFLGRNGSKEFEGNFTIHTGQRDITQMGQLQLWKGKNHTGFYEGDCGRINGSTADLWAPKRGEEDYITLFITDTCRIINLVATNESMTIEGVKGTVYETRRDTFDNGQSNPDMGCYCAKKMQNEESCPKSGATDMSTCAEGVPMYLSHANFLYADPSYAETITGLRPEYNRDRFYLVMERKLGVPMKVNAAVQISLHIRSDEDITILRDIPEFYAPLFVPASQAEMTAELSKELKFALSLPNLARNIGIGILSFGAILLVAGILLTMTRHWYGEKR